jgi:subtilisin family serine protease
VLVLDTGAFPGITAAGATTFTAGSDAAMAAALLDSGIASFDVEMWDEDGNMILDAFAGHGTFIAGLIANLAPGALITVAAGLSTFGDTDDAAIAAALLARFPEGAGEDPPFDIVTMSFGGFCQHDDPPIAMSNAIASIQTRYRAVDPDDPNVIRERVVFVASAGNAGSCRPTWPASFENVVAVGALGPNGKAWFSNYGPWVDACAPGVDIVSCFFDLGEEAGGEDEDFNGWACWSGTSFSGPIVAAAIAWEWMCRGGREMVGDKPSTTSSGRPGHAAAWLLDRPGHYRYPWLGTVVNPY